MLALDTQQQLVRHAMQLAAKTAAEGNLPFAALLIDKSGAVILECVNTVHTTSNAAAHAEINLLFEASKTLGLNDLSQYSLVSNAASCPMCATAMIKAKVNEYYYGAPNEDTMVPNISFEEVVSRTPHSIKVHGGILAEECKAEIRQLAKR